MIARGLDLSCSAVVPLEGCCKHGVEFSEFYKVGEVLYWLSNYWLRRKSCTPCNWLLNWV